MRFGRLLLGSAAVAASLWIIIGEQITGVSSDAVVNARLNTVRAPIAGQLQVPFLPFGTEIPAGAELGVLKATHVDTVRHDDLVMERAFIAAELSQIEGLLAAPGAEKNTKLGQNNHTAPALSEVAELMDAAVITDATQGQGSLGLLPYRQEPNSVPLTAALKNASDRLAAVDQRLRAENTRVASLSHLLLDVPMDGVLWEVLASNGEYVERGQDIAKLMICGSALVTLSVPDNIYARLVVGQSATFRLDGSTMLYDATIIRMAGSGAETIYRNLAVAPSLKHLERFDIALLVPKLREDPALRCSVGKTGRVFFDTRPLDWLRSALR